jgi:hypothetical protein
MMSKLKRYDFFDYPYNKRVLNERPNGRYLLAADVEQVIAQQNASCVQAGFDRETREQLQIKVVDYELQIGRLAELLTQKYPEYGLQGGQGGAVDTAISTIEQLSREREAWAAGLP